MGSLLWQLIPVALFGAIAPLPITVVVTFLMSKGGVFKATGFAAGLVGVLAVIGAITLATASGRSDSNNTGSAITGTIIAVLGVLFVLLAVKQLVNAPDPDAPPPKFMTALDTMPVGRATAFGAILALINFKQLGTYVGGIAQIVDADVSTVQQWIALVVLLIILEIGVIAPIVVFVAAQEWATRQLRRFEGWLVRHNRVLGIVLGLVVGIWFIVKGVTQIV